MMRKIITFFLLLCLQITPILAQNIEQNIEKRLNAFFKDYKTSNINLTKCKLDSIQLDMRGRKLNIYASSNFAYQPFREENVKSIYRSLKQILPGPTNYFRIKLYTSGHTIEELIPNYYKKKQNKDKLFTSINNSDVRPWTENISRPYRVSKGLEGRHIALWQSHGKYFANSAHEWKWQRPRLYGTTEDLFTQSILVPYLIPMLENAGAVVYTPRERDVQTHEVIVDNDNNSGGTYIEIASRKSKWSTIQQGFGQFQKTYKEGDNPFVKGSARIVPTEKKADKAIAEWIPNIPESGYYGVYVSYKTLPESVDDATYMVFHKGGITTFKVNQQMGGSTWVYLGNFYFDKGVHNYGMVALSNQSKQKGVITADAVRFGGGMGNIAREGKTSGLPRYLEGARYAAQWYGMPMDVYSGRKGTNDMADDINVRSLATNYLAGGSVYNPAQPGLSVPIEMSMALHSDAGYSTKGDIIGTLSIHTSHFNEGKLSSDIDRMASRDLADLIQTSLVDDINANFQVKWNRRGIWDKNYSETRLPAVPSTIIEILSHQNYADMLLGHNPYFKFIAARAIYKGILRFLSHQHDDDYVVQPLPVEQFSIQFGKKKKQLQLRWYPTADPLESTATPKEYIVYTRIGDGDFDNGVKVNKPSFVMKVKPGKLYSFKVTALNKGGESFPSEVLTAYIAPREKSRALIMNGFDRLSAPASISSGDSLGFNFDKDAGVAYQQNISLCGRQILYHPKTINTVNENSGSEWEGMIAKGNTFDYPYIHGEAMQGYKGLSFVSASRSAVENGEIDLKDYQLVDIIMGLQKEDDQQLMNNKVDAIISPHLQRVLETYQANGGNMIISGAYMIGEMSKEKEGRNFIANVLHIAFKGNYHTPSQNYVLWWQDRKYDIATQPNERVYPVHAPDMLQPLDNAFPLLLFGNRNTIAGVAYKNKEYGCVTLSTPIEVIGNREQKREFMQSLLHFLLKKEEYTKR